MKLNKLILGKADSKIIEAINEEINPSDYLRFILVDRYSDIYKVLFKKKKGKKKYDPRNIRLLVD